MKHIQRRMNVRRNNKHQAANAVVANLGRRLAYYGKCRCGWQSSYARATAGFAAQDTENHIKERKAARR